MLIFVFGIWLNAQSITYLQDSSTWGNKECLVNFPRGDVRDYKMIEKPCDEVAKEINDAVMKEQGRRGTDD